MADRSRGVLEIEQEDEIESLIREASGDNYDQQHKNGATANRNNKANANTAKSSGGATFSTVWKVVLFILIGIVLLFSTDLIEIKTTNKGTQTTKSNKPTESAVAGGGGKEDGKKKKKKENDRVKSGDIGGDDDDDPNNSPRWTYTRRGQPRSEQEGAKTAETFGTWAWPDEKKRPTQDFYKAYPTRDVPRDQFPANAWQKDAAYVSRFLQESQDLVMRAMEAILSEYGHGKDSEPGKSFEERKNMFSVTIDPGEFNPAVGKKAPTVDIGGKASSRSWNGLKRRLLHAIMTEDTFVFAMGGHSASAGHG
jgi:hypothetical protein